MPLARRERSSCKKIDFRLTIVYPSSSCAPWAVLRLSFSGEGATNGPRSLTSAVQERLRADILSTRLLPGQKLHIARTGQAVLGQPRGGARGAVAAGRRRAGAGLGPARLSGQPGIAGRPQATSRRPASISKGWRCAARSSAATRRGLRRWRRRSSRSAPFPTAIPTIRRSHYEEWVVRHRVFHRTLVNACGSQWLLGFRDVLHEQSERYRRLAIRRNDRNDPRCRGRTRRDRARHAQARCRCRGRRALEALHDDHAPRRTRHPQNSRRTATPPDPTRAKARPIKKTQRETSP